MKQFKCKCGENTPEKFREVNKTKCIKCANRYQLERYYKKRDELKEYQLSYYDDNLLKVRILSAKHRALRKNIEFNISEDDVRELLVIQNNKCIYSGIEFINNRDKVRSFSIDRKDSNKGYTKNNIQLVCSIVNTMKRDLDEKEFLEMVLMISDNTLKINNIKK